MDPEPVRLSVAADDRILVNDLPCWESNTGGTDDVAAAAATNNVATVSVVGTSAPDIVLIEQAGPKPFPAAISFSISLGADGGDELRIGLTEGNDWVAGYAYTFDLYADVQGGTASLDGVDRLVIDTRAGDDTVDGGIGETDPGPLTVPMTVEGGGGTDSLTGGSRDDRLVGQAEPDVLDGGAGTDVLVGGPDPGDTCWFVDVQAIRGCDPSLDVQPPKASPGSPVLATGTGWYPENGPISIFFGNAKPDSASVLPDGSFSVTIAAPDGAADTSVAVRACQRCGETERNEQRGVFTFGAAPALTLAITPLKASLDQTIAISGSGWIPGESVRVFVDPDDVAINPPVATEDADADSLFSTSFAAEGLGIGDHEVVACQRCGALNARTKSVALTLVAPIVAPVIDVRPRAAPVGDRVVVSGQGWRPALGPVTISIGGVDARQKITVSPGPDRSFEVPVTVPDLPAGSYTLVACQMCGGPEQIDAERAMSITAAGSPAWAQIAGLVLLAAALAFVWSRVRKPGRTETDRKPPDVDAKLSPRVPTVTVVRVHDGSVDHVVRLVPHSDPGVQRIEEVSGT